MRESTALTGGWRNTEGSDGGSPAEIAIPVPLSSHRRAGRGTGFRLICGGDSRFRWNSRPDGAVFGLTTVFEIPSTAPCASPTTGFACFGGDDRRWRRRVMPRPSILDSRDAATVPPSAIRFLDACRWRSGQRFRRAFIGDGQNPIHPEGGCPALSRSEPEARQNHERGLRRIMPRAWAMPFKVSAGQERWVGDPRQGRIDAVAWDRRADASDTTRPGDDPGWRARASSAQDCWSNRRMVVWRACIPCCRWLRSACPAF